MIDQIPLLLLMPGRKQDYLDMGKFLGVGREFKSALKFIKGDNKDVWEKCIKVA